jgi:hypothetical protein
MVPEAGSLVSKGTHPVEPHHLVGVVGPDAYVEALQIPHAREMDFTGRSMRGMVYVDSDGTSEDEKLEGWLLRYLAYARSLPPKRR